MRAQLVPLDGGAPIEIAKDLTVVGRKEDCDLRLNHNSISKMHCVLVKTDGLLLLREAVVAPGLLGCMESDSQIRAAGGGSQALVEQRRR